MAGETAVLNNKEENPPYSTDMPAMYEICGIKVTVRGSWQRAGNRISTSRAQCLAEWRPAVNPSDVTLRWHRYTDFTYVVSRKGSWKLPAIGAVIVAGAFLLGEPALSVMGFALAAIALPVWLPWRVKVRVKGDKVLASHQPPWTNAYVLILLFCVVSGVGFVYTLLARHEGTLRLGYAAVVCAMAIPYLGRIVYRMRGPLTITANHVRFGNGVQFEWATTRVECVVLKTGEPVVGLYDDAATPPNAQMVSRPYNLDFNTMMSAVAQLKAWKSEGRGATPEEIKAMLLTPVPDPLPPVGEAVDVVVSVPTPAPTGGR